MRIRDSPHVRDSRTIDDPGSPQKSISASRNPRGIFAYPNRKNHLLASALLEITHDIERKSNENKNHEDTFEKYQNDAYAGFDGWLDTYHYRD
jgi:hypothetical protein